MPVFPYNGIWPTIADDVFIAPGAKIIGDVTIHEGASIWYNAVVRGDSAPIVIGHRTNIQDNCTLHVDMKPGNEHLVSTALLSLMKPTAILINTSRGEVLDDAALAAALREKRIAGAAIDVFDPEPPKADYPLLGFDNVLLTPHMAARTHTAIENMSWVVRDVMEVLNGRAPKHPAP